METQTITVRRATEEDAPIIALLGRITFTETFNHLFKDKNDLLAYYDRTFTVAKIKEGLAKETNLFWLAFANGIPVGYAKLKLNSNSEFISANKICQLQKIYVLQDYIATGIGRKLKDELIAMAKELAFETIWLTTLKYNNERAITFYTKNKFKTNGITNYQIGKLKSELLVMSASLT